MGDSHTFTADLWEWQSRANWFFVSLPTDLSADIADQPRMPRGFDSIPITVTIGGSTWRTSMFPMGDAFALPIKAAVRRAESIEKGDAVTVSIRVRD